MVGPQVWVWMKICGMGSSPLTPLCLEFSGETNFLGSHGFHRCPFSLLCVRCSSGKQHRPTPSAEPGPSCVSFNSTQSMDPPLAFQDPAKTWWVLKQKSYDNSLACFVIYQSLCLMFRGEAQAAWRCQPICYHPLLLKTSNSWIKGECFLYRRLHVWLFGFTAAHAHLFLGPQKQIQCCWIK